MFRRPAAAAESSQPPARVSEQEYASSVVHGRAVRPPYYHQKTHGIPVASLHFRSFHHRQLDFFVHFASHAAAALGIPVSKPVHLPTERRLWTVIRGPFAHKKSQENFERRTHKRLIKAWDADAEVVDMLVRYLETHAMPGVGMRAVRWRRAPVGVGEKITQELKSRLRLGGQDAGQVEAGTKEKVKALGDAIVKREMAAAAGAAKDGAVKRT